MYFYVPLIRAWYLHLPKTGGMAIRRNGHLYVNKKQSNIPDDAYIFATLRDPIERFLSAYSMFKFGSDIRKPTRPDFTIDEALEELDKYRDCTEATVANTSEFYYHAFPITHPFWRHDLVKHWLCYQNLESEYKIFCANRGYRIPAIPRYNESKNKMAASDLTCDQKTFLTDFYMDDLDLYMNYLLSKVPSQPE